MARSLGTLTVDLLMKLGAFESDAGRAARIAEKRAKEIDQSFRAAGAAIGVALAAGITTAGYAIQSAIDKMDDLSKAAQRANMPTEQFSALAHAANLADVSMDDLAGAMGKLAKAQAEALDKNSQQAKMFEALGISAKNADGTLRSTADVFADFADKFQQFKGSPEIMAAGMQLFGRSFQNLIPLLKDGSEGLRSAFEDAERLGLVLSTQAGQQAEAFNDNLSRMKAMVGGVAMAFASELLPSLVDATDGMVEMIKNAGGAAGIMREVADAASVAWAVIKPLGIYIGTAYVASMVQAAVASGALATAMTALADAGGLVAVSLAAVRGAAAFLFGPVGLIAAGAVGLYVLATRETEAEQAAKLHKQTMDEINGVMATNITLGTRLAENKRDQAAASLKAAEATLLEMEAKAKAADQFAKDAFGSGPAAPYVAQNARAEALAQLDVVKVLRANLAQLQRTINITKGVEASFAVLDGATHRLQLLGDTGSEASRKLADESARWREEIEKTRAELEGPLAVAELEHKKRLDEIAAALKDNIINRAQATEAEQQADEKLRRQTDAIRENIAAQQARADVMGRLRSEMQEDLRLSTMSTEQRRIETQVMRAAQEAARDKQAFDIEAARKMVTEMDAQIQANEEAVRAAEGYRDAWVGAASDAARAFGDWFANGFKGAKDFAKSLKDIFKRAISDVVAMLLNNSLVTPFKNWLSQIMGPGAGGMGGVGSADGLLGGLGSMLKSGFDSLLNGFSSLFGRSGSATTAIAEGTGTAMDGWFNQLKQSGGLFGMAGTTQVGDIMLPGGAQGAGFGGLGMSPWMSALFGAVMGFGLGGDTLGKLGGGLAGGALGYGLLGASTGFASGGLAGALGGFGAAGWIGLAAFALNALTGGKLFGTKWGAESGAQQFDINSSGASGYNSVTEVRQKSFFRGREWRTTQSPLDAQAQQAINELFETLKKTVAAAAGQLGVAVPAIVGGSFRREFDKNGNLTKEFGTIAGRVYYEAQDAFAQRLIGENLLAVAKAAGSADELEQLANAYRGTGEQLQAFATAALAIQEDLLKANGIWAQVDGDGVMTRIVHYIEGMAKAGESLADAYARIQKAITDYGALIGGARQYIATHDLNQYQKSQLQVELQYREMVKQANDLAKALGLSGARSEDLATLEQWRALQMADLAKQYAAQQAQNQQWLQDLALSDLSPLTDQQKLDQAMAALQAAVDAGDANQAQKLADQVLGLGRKLYASGQDYNDLYTQVTTLIGGLSTQTMEDLQGLTNEELANLADLVSGLPAQIAQELAAVLLGTPATQPTPTPTPAPLPPAPAPAPPPSGGGGGDVPPACVAAYMLLDDGTLADAAVAGNVHGTHDPREGFARNAIRYRGPTVLRPCVTLVTRGGATLTCSATTPFTDVDAAADLPEFTTLAPDMQGHRVRVRRGWVDSVDVVVSVFDAGLRQVVPLDFGGRSFAAGAYAGALIYSHNMQKGPSSGDYGDPPNMGIMAPGTGGGSTTILADILDEIRAQNRSGKLDKLNDPRIPRYPSGVYY